MFGKNDTNVIPFSWVAGWTKPSLIKNDIKVIHLFKKAWMAKLTKASVLDFPTGVRLLVS